MPERPRTDFETAPPRAGRSPSQQPCAKPLRRQLEPSMPTLVSKPYGHTYCVMAKRRRRLCIRPDASAYLERGVPAVSAGTGHLPARSDRRRILPPLAVASGLRLAVPEQYPDPVCCLETRLSAGAGQVRGECQPELLIQRKQVGPAPEHIGSVCVRIRTFEDMGYPVPALVRCGTTGSRRRRWNYTSGVEVAAPPSRDV